MPPQAVPNLRRYSRVPFDSEVMLHVNDADLRVHLIDIALKGALLETSAAHALVLQEKCQLVLTLTAGGDVITMAGQIVHLDGSHVGVECQDIDINSLTLLRRLIELNTGDSQRVHQELSHMFSGRWVA